jgi:hypothetical protein
MTDERRYGEDEVAEIFEAAASSRGSEGRGLSSAGGFSLAELQAIGGEAGIAPERIAHAAAALDLRRGAAPRGTFLGMPVSVGRSVDLPRAPTDREWEVLVAELRETFHAHGKDSSRGELRAWSNGNLRAYVEPTETGHRLRLSTVKSNGLALSRLGVAALVAALVMMIFLFASGEDGDGMIMGAIFAAFGAAALGGNALRLPGWADQREEQMEYIASRARALIRGPEPGQLASGES